MAETTPAETLRTAAKLISETASKATPGRWYTVGLPWNHDTPYVIAGDPDPHAGRFVADVEQVFGEDDEDDRDHGPDAAWIALMSPAVAPVLVDWLKRCADEVASTRRTLDQVGRRPGYTDLEEVDEPDSVRDALALSCLILGRPQ